MSTQRDGDGPTLNEDQLMELCSPMRLVIGQDSAFLSPAVRRKAWEANLTMVRAYSHRNYRAHGQPFAFWAFDASQADYAVNDSNASSPVDPDEWSQ